MRNKLLHSKGIIIYYYCNRSGYFNSKGRGCRRLKSQGTNKLNTYCTATITTKMDDQMGQITATICHSHYGHELQLGHIPLDTTSRIQIAAQLTNGVSMDHYTGQNT